MRPVAEEQSLHGELDAELDEIGARLREHERRRGRKIRVLHVGNIANNAFHNAKLLRKLGFECDVLCHDYYHMMGCPEWEDADFSGSVGDDFRPVWHQLDLNGYERPRWFVQGPVQICLDYLDAKWSRQKLAAEYNWRMLGALNRTREPDELLEKFVVMKQNLGNALRRLRWKLSRPQRAVEIVQSRLIVTLDRAPWLRDLLRPMASLIYFFFRAAAVSLTAIGNRVEQIGQPKRDYAEAAREMQREFVEAFPEREDRLLVEDLVPYLYAVERWQPVLERYDVIQAYATDPVWAMAARRPYFAFEHGTLREIPDETTSRGRLTALAYHKAEHVFVTNSDCLENAHRLAGDRVTFINHPYDEEEAAAIDPGDLRAKLCADLNAEFLLMHPSRHDWVVGTGFADKANDVALNAFVAMRRNGLRVGMVLCSWGRNVRESRAIVESAGLQQHVLWEPPMAGRRFLTVARACDVLLDQFKLGAFGGVTFKALAAGVPVCSSLDEKAMRSVFGEAPPVIVCRSERDLLERIPPLLKSPHELRRIGDASMLWVKRHHSGRQVAAAHAREYLDFLDGRAAR